MLIIRRLDVREQPPLKTRAQAVLQADNGLWRAIAGHDNLLVRIIKCVKSVEEFLFSRFFAGDELNIVDQQNIDLPVFRAKLLCLLKADSVNNFISKLL